MEGVEIKNRIVIVIDLEKHGYLNKMGEVLGYVAKEVGTKNILFAWTTDDKKQIFILEP